MKTDVNVSRREFLKTGAAGGAALVIGFYLPWDAAAQQAPPPASNPFNAWVRVAPDGTVTLVVAKSEMGQGVRTSLPMILADELEVDWASVRIEQARTDPTIYRSLGTGGSSSVRESYLPLRQAGAAAREMLITAAAQAWSVPRQECFAAHGAVVHRPTGRRAPYGELVEAAEKLPLPDLASVPLKSPEKFQIVGKSIPRTDTPAKVDGSAVFGIDVRVPGMLYAVIARCPTFGGKPAKFEAARALAVPGVHHVVEIPAVGPGAFSAGGVAVVADTTWQAIQGREALEIEWDRGPHASESTESLWQQFRELIEQPGKVVRNEGDALAALESTAKKIEAVYELPFLAHAPMEPMNCTADVRADRAEVWAPTQFPQWNQGMVAQVTGLQPQQVTVHTTLMGGGFGRRAQADFAVEAAQVSKAVGKPVMVVWTRDDDLQHCFYRPASYHRLRGAVDEKGQPLAWWHRMVSTSIEAFWEPPDRAKPENSEVSGASDLPYAIPNIRMEYAPAKSGVPVAWWRSVEHSITGFVVEGFLDELAAAAKRNPLEFRLALLAEPRQVKNPVDPNAPPLDTARFRRVLAVAAEKAGWGKPLPKGRGRGIAAAYSFRTYVAQVAEVSVDAKGGVRVRRVVCAVDCGRVINPDIVKAQMESGIVYGLSAALKGEITIRDGAVEQANFNDYDMLRIDEMPEVEVYLVPSTEPPTGVGEPGVPPIAAAVANAIFAATGKRLRRLPVRPADLA
ncbi:MAG: xanthine dehydrogenase family protein molybdopterin-binding subunit [Acidobacteria bacterium]|nr:xanthine dehydrogenase family protein molybdopterin-binding subunit [Acidobacteriota bacterium]